LIKLEDQSNRLWVKDNRRVDHKHKTTSAKNGEPIEWGLKKQEAGKFFPVGIQHFLTGSLC